MIEELVCRSLSHGYEYVGTFTKTGGTAELIVYRQAGGIGLDDCEDSCLLSRSSTSATYWESYCLCVVSGLNRPLKTGRDYRRSVGKMVDEAAIGRQRWTGCSRHDESDTAIEIDGTERCFE